MKKMIVCLVLILSFADSFPAWSKSPQRPLRFPPASYYSPYVYRPIFKPIQTQECSKWGKYGTCMTYETTYSVYGAQCTANCEAYNKYGTCMAQNRCRYDEESGCFVKSKCSRVGRYGTCMAWDEEAICGG